MKSRAVFLDRDGVLNPIIFHQEMGVLETPFTVAQFTLKKNAGKAVRRINRLGLKAIVASNQPGLAMGNFSSEVLRRINQKMLRQLAAFGASLDDIFYCVHHPTKGKGPLKRKCVCRKPKPGLLLEAAQKHTLNLKGSYMIGDSITDVMAGRAAGCKTILLAHLKCDLCHLMAQKGVKPHFRADDLMQAVDWIEKQERKKT